MTRKKFVRIVIFLPLLVLSIITLKVLAGYIFWQTRNDSWYLSEAEKNLSEGKTGKAYSNLLSSIAINPENSKTRLQIAKLLINRGNIDIKTAGSAYDHINLGIASEKVASQTKDDLVSLKSELERSAYDFAKSKETVSTYTPLGNFNFYTEAGRSYEINSDFALGATFKDSEKAFLSAYNSCEQCKEGLLDLAILSSINNLKQSQDLLDAFLEKNKQSQDSFYAEVLEFRNALKDKDNPTDYNQINRDVKFTPDEDLKIRAVRFNTLSRIALRHEFPNVALYYLSLSEKLRTAGQTSSDLGLKGAAANTFILRGKAFFMLQKLAEAETALKVARVLQPYNLDINYDIAKVMLMRGDKAGAKTEFEQALLRDYVSETMLRDYLSIIDDGQKRVEVAKKLYQVNPSNQLNTTIYLSEIASSTLTDQAKIDAMSEVSSKCEVIFEKLEYLKKFCVAKVSIFEKRGSKEVEDKLVYALQNSGSDEFVKQESQFLLYKNLLLQGLIKDALTYAQATVDSGYFDLKEVSEFIAANKPSDSTLSIFEWFKKLVL